MAAMKPRTGDGPMEAEREPRGLIILRVPLEGGGRLVVSVTEEEAKNQYEIMFRKPDAMSRAPICNGIRRFEKVPLKPAVRTKNTMMVP